MTYPKNTDREPVFHSKVLQSVHTSVLLYTREWWLRNMCIWMFKKTFTGVTLWVTYKTNVTFKKMRACIFVQSLYKPS